LALIARVLSHIKSIKEKTTLNSSEIHMPNIPAKLAADVSLKPIPQQFGGISMD
jgi:hypothetical protein